MSQNKQKLDYSQRLRIISGELKGRKVSVLNEQGLRPTTDRMRETLYNWLLFEIAGRRVLDAYAGSGILGIEALSRGAQFVQFIDSSGAAIKQIAHHLDEFKVSESQYKLTQADSLNWLDVSSQQPFNLVFLDPPFSSNLLADTIALLDRGNWLAKSALIYTECSAKEKQVSAPMGWKCLKQKKMGQSLATLWLNQV